MPSRRSNKGKEVYKLEEDLTAYENTISRLYHRYQDICSKPAKAWGLWIEQTSQIHANKNALITMLVLFPAMFFLIGFTEHQDFIYAAKLYAYSSFVLPTQVLGELTGFFLIEPLDLKVFSAPFEESFDFKIWALTMLPVPFITYIIYKITLFTVPNKLISKVPKPRLYDET